MRHFGRLQSVLSDSPGRDTRRICWTVSLYRRLLLPRLTLPPRYPRQASLDAMFHHCGSRHGDRWVLIRHAYALCACACTPRWVLVWRCCIFGRQSRDGRSRGYVSGLRDETRWLADTLWIDRTLCSSVMRLIGRWEDSIMKRLGERYV